MGSLEGRIAVVTGASRGIGRGVAEELGAAGAVVYVTGRSREGAATPEGLTIHPGLTRTERVERHAPPEQLTSAHSARYVGRAVVALACDPALREKAGGVFKVAELGRAYGFRDVDGSQPEPFRMPEGYGE